jgi:hypothetical protein
LSPTCAYTKPTTNTHGVDNHVHRLRAEAARCRLRVRLLAALLAWHHADGKHPRVHLPGRPQRCGHKPESPFNMLTDIQNINRRKTHIQACIFTYIYTHASCLPAGGFVCRLHVNTHKKRNKHGVDQHAHRLHAEAARCRLWVILLAVLLRQQTRTESTIMRTGYGLRLPAAGCVFDCSPSWHGTTQAGSTQNI